MKNKLITYKLVVMNVWDSAWLDFYVKLLSTPVGKDGVTHQEERKRDRGIQK